jgi:hypothetical protein
MFRHPRVHLLAPIALAGLAGVGTTYAMSPNERLMEANAEIARSAELEMPPLVFEGEFEYIEREFMSVTLRPDDIDRYRNLARDPDFSHRFVKGSFVLTFEGEEAHLLRQVDETAFFDRDGRELDIQEDYWLTEEVWLKSDSTAIITKSMEEPDPTRGHVHALERVPIDQLKRDARLRWFIPFPMQWRLNFAFPPNYDAEFYSYVGDYTYTGTESRQGIESTIQLSLCPDSLHPTRYVTHASLNPDSPSRLMGIHEYEWRDHDGLWLPRRQVTVWGIKDGDEDGSEAEKITVTFTRISAAEEVGIPPLPQASRYIDRTTSPPTEAGSIR